MNSHWAKIAGIALAFLLPLAGCGNMTPHITTESVPPISGALSSFTPDPRSAPEFSSSQALPTQSADDGSRDAFGNAITSREHFKQFLRFENIRVYEYGGETLLDLTAVNLYPEPLICALSVEFYDSDGRILASSSIQGPDGSFLLTLPSGRTPLFASIPTDTVLTDKELLLVFDERTPVAPAATK